ncbi:MAG: fasciclin domain-containing protein [Spirosomataceae bacterium]
MKNLIGGLLLLFVMVSGCKQDAPQPKSMSDVLLEENDLGMLRAAIKYAGLEDAFKTSSLTLFAPSDEGFKASGYADVAAITALPPDQVRALITNHVVTSKLATESMPLGQNNPLKMMSGARLFLSNIDGTPYLNQAKGTKSNLVGTNGVIHIINRVIPIPTQSLAQLIKNTPDFSLFRQATRRALLSEPRLAIFYADTLNTGPVDPAYTMFIPTNQAMIAAKLSQGEISAASPINLARIVSYHIALSRYFSTFLPNGSLNMFDASYTTTVENKSTGLKITGRGNPTPPANITKTDLTGTNGVIHTIDKVLIP